MTLHLIPSKLPYIWGKFCFPLSVHSWCHTYNSGKKFARICCIIWKIYDGELIITVISNIGEGLQYRCVNEVNDVKSVSQPDSTVCYIWKPLLFANNRNRVRRVVLGLSQDGACTDLFENLSENSLQRDLSNDNIVKTCLFSHRLIPLWLIKNILVYLTSWQQGRLYCILIGFIVFV